VGKKAEANKPDSIRHCFRVQKNNKVDILVDDLTKLYKPRRPYFCVYIMTVHTIQFKWNVIFR
jgi:hypothetical protein